MDSITIRKPDDFHVHLRDGAMLDAVAPFTAARFGRAIVMPNLAPDPVTTMEKARAYRERVLEATKEYPKFTPLMTIYLTEHSSPDDIEKGFRMGVVKAVKLYPAHATTNSAQGVTDMSTIAPVLGRMEQIGMPLLIHGETLRDFKGIQIEPARREEEFVKTTLPAILAAFPELKVVLEHVTTAAAVEFVKQENPRRLAATITAHHLLMTADDIAMSSAPQYLTCMPVPKRLEDVEALQDAAMSGDAHFFLGTDSAPHPVSAKEGDSPPPGIFTAAAGIELYAHIFDKRDSLSNLETFASINGAKFYGLPVNEETITLVREPGPVDTLVKVGHDSIRPFGYSENPAEQLTLDWKIAA